MTVLHYISDLTHTSSMTKTVMRMIQATSKTVDLHLLTSVPLSENTLAALREQLGVTVHTIGVETGANPLHYIEYYKEVRARLLDINPHIVHVHGAWDIRPAIVQRCASRNNMVTIVSPHKGMSPEIIDIDFWKSRLWRILTYQAMMVSKSTAVVAVNEKEKNDILNLGLKRRIEVLPCVTSEQTLWAMGTALVEAYRKALDSSYRRFLQKEERAFLNSVVKKAVADVDVKVEIPSINGLSFRRISFLAYDEGATELMQRGADKSDIYLPQAIDVANITRYKTRKAKILKSLDEMSQSLPAGRIPESQMEERRAVRLISKAKELTLKRLTLYNWVELYELFRYCDFNEDIVAEELRQCKLKGFTKKLQKRLSERFGLKEGYMIF